MSKALDERLRDIWNARDTSTAHGIMEALKTVHAMAIEDAAQVVFKFSKNEAADLRDGNTSVPSSALRRSSDICIMAANAIRALKDN